MSEVGEPGPPDFRVGCAYGYLVGQWTSSGNSAAECLYAVQNLNVDSDGRTPFDNRMNFITKCEKLRSC